MADYFNERRFEFATKLIPGILKKLFWGYPIGDWRSQIEKQVVVSVRSNLPQKSPTVPFEPKFGPPTNKKIPRPPPPVIYHKLLLISRPAPTPFLANVPGNKKNTSDYKPPGCETPSNFYSVYVLK